MNPLNEIDEFFFAVSADVIDMLEHNAKKNYPVCEAHRKEFNLATDIDLKRIDCETQICRHTCPVNSNAETTVQSTYSVVSFFPKLI